MRMTLAVVVMGLLAGSGCATTGTTEAELRSRASLEMSCPQPQLQLVQLAEQTMGVQGCGRRATYVVRCETRSGLSECQWVANGQAVAAPPPPPPPGGPPPMSPLEVTLHQGLDAHREAISTCTGGAAAEVLATYAPDGSVEFTLAGALGGTFAERCVRNALGPVHLDTHGTSGVVHHPIPIDPRAPPPTSGGETPPELQ